MLEVDIAACKRDFGLVGREGETDRTPDGVLEAFAQHQRVWRAEAIIVIAAEPLVAVDVRSAECWLEIERNDIASRSDRFGDKKSHRDRTFAISLDGRATGAGGSCALIRAVKALRLVRSRIAIRGKR